MHQKTIPEEDLTLRRAFFEEKIIEAVGADKICLKM